MSTTLKNNLVYIIALLLVIGGLVWLGFKFLKPKNNNVVAQTTDNQPTGDSQSGGWAGRGNRQGGRGNFSPPVHGTIQSISGNNIILTADDGSTKNVTTDANTRITDMENGERTQLALSDLANGESISVMNSGTDTTNITARMIFIGTFTPGQGRGNWGGGSQNSNDSQSTSGSSAL